MGLRAERLGLVLADVLVRLESEVGAAEDEGYTAGLYIAGSVSASWECD